jgi:hypothetical protein
VNLRLHHTLWCFIGALAIGCGHTKRTLIYDKSTALPGGRFVGPIELELPAQEQRPHRWFEIRAELEARCGPLLAITYPDGEVARLGDRDEKWQALQRQRAEHRTVETPATRDPETTAEPNGPGRWRQAQTERWPGQIEFLRGREARCSRTRTFRRVHLTAVDRDQRLALWAEVPQELAGAKLRVKVYRVVDVDGEKEAAERARAEERARTRARARAEAGVEVRPPRPRPPKPKPRVEKPPPAEADGARWTPGTWHWYGTEGKWVWISGRYEQPATAPALRAEDPGVPPVAGCTWARGHWVWVPGSGSWRWNDGHWNAPPPRTEDPGPPPWPGTRWIPGQWVRVGASFEWRGGRWDKPPPKTENPGPPPIPEQSWVAGYWVRVGDGWEWRGGHWGKPRPREEARPPRPSRGARWQPGVWLKIKGAWTWEPGHWISAGRTPPPRRAERPGRRPHPDAVWLKGFWRWSAASRGFKWIAGRWELPPGEGYVWVPDPVDPGAGVSISGKWKLRIEVDVKVDR